MNKTTNSRSQASSLFFAGLLPVIAFTLIEEYYGTWAGLIAGMVFGCGELIYEKIKYHQIQKITWIGNGLLLGLGGVSLVSSEGIWFKLQPAILEGVFTIVLWFSIIAGKPLLSYLAEQQGHILPDLVRAKMKGITFRTGCFFAFHAGLATWAAFNWTTGAWAILKGLGLTLTFILYLIVEVIVLRHTIARK
jgi:intracellular septation protein